ADGLFVALEQAAFPNPGIAHVSSDGISWARSRLPAGSISLNESDDSFWLATSGTGAANTIAKLRLRAPGFRLRTAPDETGQLTLEFEATSAGRYTVLSSAALD